MAKIPIGGWYANDTARKTLGGQPPPTTTYRPHGPGASPRPERKARTLRPVYCTREQVKTALDSVETARNNRRIDRHIRSGAESLDRLTHRTFYPQLATRTFDWPAELVTPQSWRLWLDENMLAGQPTAVTSGGVALNLADVYARPDNGPPFDHLEIKRSSSAAWTTGATAQRSLSVAGLFAGDAIVDVTASTLAAGINASVTACTIGASWEVGVGSLLTIGTERLNVVGRSMVTTGQTLQVPMDNQQSSTTVTVTTGSAFIEDEVILIGEEKMLVEEIAGNDLIVKRKWDGTVLASHNGETIYAARSLTVERGACGTTAASHSLGDVVSVWRPPDLVNKYNIAYAVCGFLNESSGYARTVGAGDNERESPGAQFAQLKKEVARAYYRIRVGTAS